ncbi:MAG: SPOR domain-containing protein [Pseudomonadota bacterium]
MRQDPFAYDVDELVGSNKGSIRPLVIGLTTMLAIGVLSALVLMEPPMAQSFEVTDEDRIERLLAIPRDGQNRPAPETAPTPETESGRQIEEAALRPSMPLPDSGPPTITEEISRLVPSLERTQEPDPIPPSAPSASPPVREVAATVDMATLPTAPSPSPKPVATRRPQPAPRPTPSPLPTLGQAADGPFAIQFGSMSTAAKAEAEIARFRAMAPELFARTETGIETTRLDDGRTVNRMRISGITRKSDARAWCRAFKARGGSCFVIG